MYAVTKKTVGAIVVAVTLGVHQGSPTLCLLFIIFVNDHIKMLNEGVEIDGFVSWLRILVVMDDTVLIATTRENIARKQRILRQYCNEYGMRDNNTTTKYLVVNESEVEKEPVHC